MSYNTWPNQTSPNILNFVTNREGKQASVARWWSRQGRTCICRSKLNSYCQSFESPLFQDGQLTKAVPIFQKKGALNMWKHPRTWKHPRPRQGNDCNKDVDVMLLLLPPLLSAFYCNWPIFHSLGHIPIGRPKNLRHCWSETFYRPDVLYVTQPTASKHWRNRLSAISVKICTIIEWWTRVKNYDTKQKYRNGNLTNRAQFAKKLGNFVLSISKRHDLGWNTVLQYNSQQKSHYSIKIHYI